MCVAFRKIFPAYRRLHGDDSGAAAIEFVLWTPLLLFWFVASAFFYDVFKRENAAANAAYVIGDILSRQVEVDDAFIQDLHTLQASLLPNTPDGKWIRATSIEFKNDAYSVLWSRSVGGGAPITDEMLATNEYKLPTIAEFDSVLMLEAYVPYVPFVEWFGIGERTWSNLLFMRPRFVSSVAMVED